MMPYAACQAPLNTTLKQTGIFGQAVIRPLQQVTLVLAGRRLGALDNR